MLYMAHFVVYCGQVARCHVGTLLNTGNSGTVKLISHIADFVEPTLVQRWPIETSVMQRSPNFLYVVF